MQGVLCRGTAAYAQNLYFDSPALEQSREQDNRTLPELMDKYGIIVCIAHKAEIRRKQVCIGNRCSLMHKGVSNSKFTKGTRFGK